jgi:hypothetical protein
MEMEEEKRRQATDSPSEYDKHDALLAASAKLVAEMQSLLERARALSNQNVEIIKKLDRI